MDGISAAQSIDNETAGEAVTQIMLLLQSAGLTVAEQSFIAANYLAQLSAQQASAQGFQDANLIVCLVFLLMLPLTFFIRKPIELA